MKIIGYSERGAMNALFYGMAHKDKVEDIKAFLALAKVEDLDYTDFDLFMEFSLSEYGDPDLVIIGKKNDLFKTVFFVEAKASSGKTYDLRREKMKHDGYINGNIKDKSHASNLFFQLRLKECFNKRIKGGYFDGGIDPCSNYPSRLRQCKNRERKIGKNPIVLKMVDEIKKCGNAEYIAVIPKQKTTVKTNDDYDFTIHFVEWEDIQGDNKLNTYLNETVVFNGGEDKKGKSVNQILNNKFTKIQNSAKKDNQLSLGKKEEPTELNP